MKLIFLDFDGVLNSYVYMDSPEYLEETKGMIDWEVIQKAHHTHLDPKSIAILNQLVAETGAVVIISSTWRLRYSLAEMNLMLENRGATFRASGVTKALRMYGSKRGDEIQDYLDNCLDEPEAFVIIDDINFFDACPNLLPHFVHVQDMYGIRSMDVGKAIKILNGK
jgi:hypothetical protein